MNGLSRLGVALLMALAAAGLAGGCGQENPKRQDQAEQNTREDGGAAKPQQDAEARQETAPDGVKQSEVRPEPQERAEPQTGQQPGQGPATDGEAAPETPEAPQSGSPPGEEKSATSDGDDSLTRGIDKPKPPAPPSQPSPTAPPPPPPRAEATPAEPVTTPPPGAAATVDQTFDVVPVFFGTDRAVEPDVKRLKYGADRGHKLELGRALVSVPTAHKVPNIERPWVIEIPSFKVKIYEEAEDTAKHFTLQEISALTKEQMLALVKERLAKSNDFKDHAIVFVHGFNTSFDYALYRTAQIAYDLKFDGVPFVYSWPSGAKVASYTYDRGSAEQAEPHLAEFLDFVVKESGAKSISLIAHSMGNELLLRVLERMRPAPPGGVVISQVILAAPDVDRDKFENIAREITGFAKGVTLYAAANDRALGTSARFWGGIPRAGDVPASGPLIVPGVDTIDVSAVSTDSLGLNHSGYAENNALLADIKLLIQTGERPPDKRIPILERMTTAAGGAYWRYPPLR
ncbi:MAG: alpha/beta hydrolase [Hyphomicrobium sp.]